MSLNAIPSSERVHISFFGCTNAGKSSVVNAFLNQNISIVSEVKGTTTDPVEKAMELLPMGAVKIIDTAGFDDFSELGKARADKTKKVIDKTDVAVLVVDRKLNNTDNELIKLFKDKKIPYIIAFNKADLLENLPESTDNIIYISAKTGFNIKKLKEIVANLKDIRKERPLVSDLVSYGDIVVLVVPIDSAAPKGRLILPQQQVIRDLLESGAIPVVVRDSELETTLKRIDDVELVITDSQVFNKVSKIVPENIPLTSFSIIMARYKGDLSQQINGVNTLDNLSYGDKILIAEGCTHHRQCDDIGTVKLPKWIREYTKKDFDFSFCSGTEFPQDLSKYNLIVHCGGCMLNDNQMKNRLNSAKSQNIPITNYGTIIAHMNGILKRATAVIKPLDF